MTDGQFRTEIQYGRETTYGTEVATDTEIGKVLNFTPRNNNNFQYTTGLGEGRNATHALYGNYDCGGDITWEVSEFAFLKHWVGPLSGSGTTAAPYLLTESDYVGVTAATDITPFSLEVNHQNLTADDTDTYTGCVGDALTLSAELGGRLVAKASFAAQKVTSSTTGTAYTPVTINPWIAIQGTYKWGATPTTMSGVQAFSITMKNKLITSYDLDSRFITIPVAGLREYTFSTLIKMNSAVATTLRDNFYGQANSPYTGVASATPTAGLSFKIELSEGATTGKRNAVIWLDQCSIDTIGKPINIGNGLVMLQVDGHGKYGTTNAPIRWWTAT